MKIFKLEYKKSSFVHDIEKQVQANENISDVLVIFVINLGMRLGL